MHWTIPYSSSLTCRLDCIVHAFWPVGRISPSKCPSTLVRMSIDSFVLALQAMHTTVEHAWGLIRGTARQCRVDTGYASIAAHVCMQAAPVMIWQTLSARERDAAVPMAAMLDPSCIDTLNEVLAVWQSRDTIAVQSAFDSRVGAPPHLTQWPPHAHALVRPELAPPCC